MATRVFVIIAMIVSSGALADDGWTEPVPVMNRAKIALTYRAGIAGEYLIVEANHTPGWHTYAMDNMERAREASGDENPESEQPTRIAISGGAKAAGAWRQTPPEDLSRPDIHWFTWGFEGVARFAVPIERTGDGDIVVTISAQSCDAASCTMVKELKTTLPQGSAGPRDAALLKDLVEVDATAATGLPQD
jgi:hypothetical protein